MCGVCGIASFEVALPRDTTLESVGTMVKALAHRGPDDSGIATEPRAMLGATRLAIRGLHSGKQPMVDGESGVIVVCNGEIDNHRELRHWLVKRGRTPPQTTDIAVIAGLYLELGEAFVERLIGVFAIAVWDPRQQLLLLARDRAGERPLFFSMQQGIVRFATEIAALAPESTGALTLSRAALQEYLQFGCLAAPTTPFLEIEKVGPAEIVTIKATGIGRRRYWRWNIERTPKPAPVLDRFDEIFRKAVLRQSDVEVPYGVFLSGGLDSSLVAAVARSLRPDYPLTAYTLRFSEESYDEGQFAEQVAAALGVKAVSVWVEPEVFPETIADLVCRVGEPLADPAWIPTVLLARRAAQDTKLALVGEGGDELFGGYPTYLGAQLGELYARLPRALQAIFKRAVEAWPPSDKKVTLLKRFVQGTDMDGVARHLLWTSNISPAVRVRLGFSVMEPRAAGQSAEGLLDTVQQIDLETRLAEGLLTKADRASMLSAVELRTPFLDQGVMEFAASLPVNERVRGLTTKFFLKKYARRYLPGSIVNRRKRGLSVPLSAWLRGPLYAWAQTLLGSDRLNRVGINGPVALELLEEHRRREADHARALWALMVLSEWLAWTEQTLQVAATVGAEGENLRPPVAPAT
jgi:asparagine synthase (glutamine-hydrolysing)